MTQPPVSSCRFRWRTAILPVIFTAAQLSAQTAPPEAQAASPRITSPAGADDYGELVILDRFVVSGAEDAGSYEATATMAATRIRTELKDVGSAISVITAQFLKDTGARNSQDLLVYTTNTEVGGPRGNFSGLGDSADLSDQNARLAPQTNTRVRGLTAADNTRDFFLTDIPWDSFNTGRIDIQRGPNAILFGLGSPAGIINASINGAAFKNGGSAELRTGRFGSRRATLDVNQVLQRDELALRLDLLDDRTNYEQRPAFNHDRRWSGALRWDPKFLRRGSARTSLKFNFEHGVIDANRPHVLPPTDLITPWFTELNKQGVNPATWQGDSNVNTKVTGFGSFIFSPILAFFGNTSTTDSYLTMSGGPNSSLARVLSPADYLPKPSSPAEQFKLYRPSQLQDPSIFDYVHQLPEGPNKHEWSHHDVDNATLSQTFLNDRLGLEVAYDRQQQLRASLQGFSGTLNVDINTNRPDGSPNPNFGRAFLETAGTNGTVFRSTREAERLTGFGELRFKDMLGDSRLARWLGRHVITGLWSHERAETETYDWLGQTADAAFVPYWFNDPRVEDRTISTVNYIGPSLANRTTASGANLPNLTTVQPVNSGPLRYFDYGSFAWINLPLGVVTNADAARVQANHALLRRDDVTSTAIVWQAFLFDDVLVPMIGLRHDNDRSYALTNPPLNPDGSTDFASSNYRLPATPNSTVAGNSTSWSVVMHSPRFIRDKLPGDTDISVFYNHSENFQPKAGRVDPFGTALAPPVGRTKDYGFRLAMLGGRITAKVLWFDTVVANDTLPEFSQYYYTTATEAWGYQFARQTLDNNGNGSFYMAGGYLPAAGQTAAQAKADGLLIASAFLDPKNLPPDSFFALHGVNRSPWQSYQPLAIYDPASFGVTITGDTRSRGTEYELTAQPVPSWNLTFNASRTEAQSHNLAQSVAAWIEQRWAVFNTPVAGTSSPAVIGSLRMWSTNPFTDTILSTYYSNIWLPYKIYRAKENSTVHELRPWRFNLVSDYKFAHGRLKGLNFGGAYRWQDREVVGYPVLPTASTTSVQDYDLAHPYLGPATTSIDLWAGYERKISRKLTWRVQWNVNNVFAKKELIPVAVQPDGSLATGRIPEPTIWSVTNSISF